MSAPPATMSALRSRVAFKQIHITMSPTPRNLTESRLVLQALQKFGEVVTFRNLKYDPTNSNTLRDRHILAIFDNADAAKRAIEASPLTIPIPRNTTTTEAFATGKPFADPWSETSSDKDTHVMTCQIEHSIHSHESSLLRNPYHSTYRVLTNSFQYHDLTKSTGIPLPELADTRLGRKRHAPLRIKRRIEAENERLGATSLMKMYEEGLQMERVRNANKAVDAAVAADVRHAVEQAREMLPQDVVQEEGLFVQKDHNKKTKEKKNMEFKFPPLRLPPQEELEAMRERWRVGGGLLAE
ncbi:hypothetical protein VTN00DRAFT_7825 [Thermoascus crustaceus]|uniref:uncharacterized protein n=1 Tax=Thermoascus crustaceus TaxID=5088 RepID=UPI003743CF3A